MKSYIVLITEGLRSQEIKAESTEELYKKIDSGHYHILHIRSRYPIKITRQNIKEIIEIID